MMFNLESLGTLTVRAAIAAIVLIIFAWLYRRRLPGGIIGGLVISIVGAVIGDVLLKDALDYLYQLVMQEYGINLLATSIGALVFIWIFTIVYYAIKD